MNCLILGGGGFLGSHLCEALLAEGHRVRVFERPRLKRDGRARFFSQAEWVEGDFTNPVDISQTIEGCEVVFHLIWSTLPKTSNDNPIYDLESNVVSTLRLLDAVKKNKVQKFIFVSSGGTVYGIPKQIPISETHPTNPICSYGITKLAIEKYLNLYQHEYGLDYCVLRVSNLFGERQQGSATQGAIAVFLDKALKGETIEIWGDGHVVRDYVYVGDVTRAFLKAMHYLGDSDVFNIGSGQGHSLNDLLKMIESLLGRPVRHVYGEGRALDVPINVLDISKANRLLGWKPNTTLQNGLMLTLDWIRHQRNSD